MTMLERGEDPDQREQSGAEIGQRNAGLDRRAAGVAGDRHDPGDALGDEIEAALVAVRSGLTVAGNRRVDETRVDALKRRVVEAERGEDAWPIILDEDVR